MTDQSKREARAAGAWMRAAAAVALAGALAGCAINEQIRTVQDSAATQTEQARQRAAFAERPAFVENQGVWLNTRATLVRRDELPPVFSQPVTVTVQPRATLRDLATLLATTTGMSYTFAPEVAGEAGSAQLPAGFNKSGSLRALLDLVSSSMGMSWRLQGGSVYFYRVETKIFTVAVSPGQTGYSASVTSKGGVTGGGGGGGSSGGGGASTASGADARVTVSLNAWDAIRAQVKDLLSPLGKFSASETMRSVTVTDTPAALQAVEAYINQVNAVMSKQVRFDVRVLTVLTSRQNNVGVDWTLVWKNAGSGLGITLGTPSLGGTGGQFIGTLSGDAAKPWDGSSLIVKALAQVGKVTDDRQVSDQVLNNETLPLFFVTEQTYLAKASSTISNGTSQVSLEPGTATYGLTMNLLPSIINNEMVQLQTSFELSTLELSTISSGGQTLQTPKRTSSNAPSRRVMVRSGDTLVMMFQQKDTRMDEAGIGSTKNLAAGSQSGQDRDFTYVVLLTPRVLTTP